MRETLKTIMYVEDDPDIQMVAQIALEVVGGLDLHTFGSGKDAVAAAAAFKPDLLLLDVMMPGMDGPMTLSELRKLPNTAATPVIFMTAKVQTAEVAHYRSLGALGVIAKPFDPMLLASQVRQLWTEEAA
jgi:two-component system OmpR family response regulator